MDKCPVCNEKYKSTPLFLPCGWTVCDTHIKNDEIKQCFQCDNEHNAKSGEYKINQQVLTNMKNEQLRMKVESEKKKLSDFKNTVDYPVQFIEKVYETHLKELQNRMEKVQSILEKYVTSQKELIDEAKKEHLRRYSQDEQKILTELSNFDFEYFENELIQITKQCDENYSGIELLNRLKNNEETIEGCNKSIESHLEVLSMGQRSSITQFDQEKLNDNSFLANLFGRFILHDTQPKCHIQQQSECIATIPRAQLWLITTMAYNSLHKILITGSDMGEIKLWDCGTKESTKTIKKHTKTVNSILIQKNFQYFFSASDDKSIKYMSIVNGECVNSIDDAHTTHVLSLLETSDGRLVSCSSDYIKIWRIDAQTLELLRDIEVVSIQCMCLSNKNELYTGSDDQSVKLWDLDSGKCLKTLTTNNYKNIQSILLLNNDEICLGFDNGSISVWNSHDGQCTKQFNSDSENHTGRITQFLINGTDQIISCSHDQTIKVWSLESGECVKTLEGHDKAVLCMAFVNDGILASGSSGDNSIKFWH